MLGCCLFSVIALSGCAHTPPDDPADPLEGINRPVFAFNQKVNRHVIEPVARGYVRAVPQTARNGISNFFSNLFYPKVIVNDLLQAKFLQSLSDLGRFLLNSSAGLGGLMDVATRAGLPEHNEDFGQTLGYWGIGPGWYLVIPFLGPMDNRDAIGFAGDYFANPLTYVRSQYDGYVIGVTALYYVDLTSTTLLDYQNLIDAQVDPYVFVRTAYLQRRQALVYDGHPPVRTLELPDSADESDEAPGPDKPAESGTAGQPAAPASVKPPPRP
ncbi:MAG: VacJ family lipoprotein [Gammaproteobacteria bacterium]|nr:VacJ family lipoprotein [Gammaproteobacteria bacterium]